MDVEERCKALERENRRLKNAAFNPRKELFSYAVGIFCLRFSLLLLPVKAADSFFNDFLHRAFGGYSAIIIFCLWWGSTRGFNLLICWRVKNEFQCPMCREESPSVHKLPFQVARPSDCNHYGCTTCLVDWMSSATYNGCPLCRKESKTIVDLAFDIDVGLSQSYLFAFWCIFTYLGLLALANKLIMLVAMDLIVDITVQFILLIFLRRMITRWLCPRVEPGNTRWILGWL